MTIQEAIDRARALRETEVPDEAMRDWLDVYDENTWERTLKHYVPGGTPTAFPYKANDDWRQIELLLPDKYGLDIYPAYLTMKIDYHHGDIDRYNNGAILFNEADKAMRLDYSRTKTWVPTADEMHPPAPWDPHVNVRF